jgi:hypothetical protein
VNIYDRNGKLFNEIMLPPAEGEEEEPVVEEKKKKKKGAPAAGPKWVDPDEPCALLQVLASPPLGTSV